MIATVERENDILHLAIANCINIDPSLFKYEDTRCGAYLAFGWTDQAFDDESWIIRREAYRALGYNKDALNDEFDGIRDAAKAYLKLKNEHTEAEADDIIKLWRLEMM